MHNAEMLIKMFNCDDVHCGIIALKSSLNCGAVNTTTRNSPASPQENYSHFLLTNKFSMFPIVHLLALQRVFPYFLPAVDGTSSIYNPNKHSVTKDTTIIKEGKDFLSQN